jgi:hypothetical protein
MPASPLKTKMENAAPLVPAPKRFAQIARKRNAPQMRQKLA